MLKEKGFTIIELIVTISIISVLLVVSIANFPNIKLQFALSRVTYTFAQNVRKAQGMALSGVPYKDSLGIEKPVDGYGIYVDIGSLGNKKYILYADKFPGNQEYDASDYVVDAVNLSSSEPGIIIKEIDGVLLNKASINFQKPDSDVEITDLESGQSSAQIVFAQDSDATKTRAVLVNTTGLIEVK